MKRDDLYRVLVQGGVISPNEMKQIIKMARMLDLEYVHFGSRQDVLLPAKENVELALDQFPELEVNLVGDRKYQNIVSSYVSANIFSGTSWLKGENYLYILSSFKHKPTLKVNIVDPKQSLVPLVTGDLNFIASPHMDYWYLFIRMGKDGLQRFPVLVYSWDIAKVCVAIEESIEDVESIDDLYQEVIFNIDSRSRTITEDLAIPHTTFPNYEGINPEGIDKYWLGLYWRDNKYDLDFLEAMADYCTQWKVGRINITPWKSFVVKGIPKAGHLHLEKMLGKFGINVRHSSLELNWHLPVNVDEALELKKFIVMNFDQNDISTRGLTFGLASRTGINFTSIVINKNEPPVLSGNYAIRPTYDVLYSKDFDPNNEKYIVYAQDVDRMELPGLLMELSKMYFKQLDKIGSKIGLKVATRAKANVEYDVLQCKTCFTVYDPKLGDKVSGIEPDTDFSDLSDAYCCSTCGADKSNFEQIAASAIYN